MITQQNKIEEVNISIIPESYRIVRWKDLHMADLTFNSTFRIHFSDGQFFVSEQILRLIPKRRMSVLGKWQDKPAIAKLFFSDQHARAHMEKDKNGIMILKENNIPTPSLYYSGVSEDRRIYVLIFECLHDAQSIEDIWRFRAGVYPKEMLQAMMIELATQHVLGVVQHDLHLKNFLSSGKHIYTLDGSQVEKTPPLLNKKMSMKCLSLFLAQLGVGFESEQENLFRYYARSRGWLIKKGDRQNLFSRIKQWNNERSKKFAKKIFRNSSDFVIYKNRHLHGMYDRKYSRPELMNIMTHPESAFSHPSALVLKSGRSSTVIKVTLDQKELVIKRYNIKDSWHGLRRGLRNTRAQMSWAYAQKLGLFYIPSLKPVAFLEKRILGVRGTSYFISEYISAESASDFFNRSQDEDVIIALLKRIIALIKNLAAIELTHGDLKLTNILIDQQGEPVLIDLDGMREHRSIQELDYEVQKDMHRLLKNFANRTDIYQHFMRLVKVSSGE